MTLLQDLQAISGLRLWTQAPLAPFTTIGTGGNAMLLLTVSHQEALVAALRVLEGAATPWFCLGAGSNLLVADEGCSTVVIKLGEGFHYVEGLPSASDCPADGESVTLTVGAGSHLAHLAAVVAESGLSGLEFAGGIPGSVGGGVAMNAGAHGGALADVVEAVQLVSSTGVVWRSAGSLVWAYRECSLPSGSVVTAVRLRLLAGDAQVVVADHRVLLRTRRRSQPRGVRTFGSVFKNPPGHSAGKLLDEAGLKGVRRGDAEVSTVHANFLVNLGDATTADMLALMTFMRDTVHHFHGILLQPEVKLVGRDFPWDIIDDSVSPGLPGGRG
ncbi:MAG: UDP-N-acetylmuramate dehydrogenase [Thermoleophilia bacterium]